MDWQAIQKLIAGAGGSNFLADRAQHKQDGDSQSDRSVSEGRLPE
jgi:hypothetical protein